MVPTPNRRPGAVSVSPLFRCQHQQRLLSGSKTACSDQGPVAGHPRRCRLPGQPCAMTIVLAPQRFSIRIIYDGADPCPLNLPRSTPSRSTLKVSGIDGIIIGATRPAQEYEHPMSSILERARRARRHYGTDAPIANPSVEHERVQDSVGSQPPTRPTSATDLGPPRPDPTPPLPHWGLKDRSRIGAAWISAVVAVLLITGVLIFLLQNMVGVDISFLGASGTLPFGVAMLLAVIAGALLFALISSARRLQGWRASRRRLRL